MMLKVLFLALLSQAWGYDLEPLRSNGAVFTRGESRMPLRCLDAAGLLDMDALGQEGLLDKAAAAGFNSVSFAAPAFGVGGFCRKLGWLDPGRVGAFMLLLTKMQQRNLYAVPVLWNAKAVEAFSRIGGGPDKFFTGKIQNQWQVWLIRELLKSPGPESLSATAAIGAWMLYRGPWPGPKKREVGMAAKGATQAFTAPFRAWLLWQIRAFRQGGATQMLGAGFILKSELGDKAALEDPAVGKADTALPLAEIRQEETKLSSEAAMDKLPPLPGAEKVSGYSSAAEALTPWDLEGVDWDSVGRAMRDIPVSTGIDFMEITLDTEDWYRVGEAMTGVAEKEMQAPLIWRHDWRSASRYERQKRLEAPEGLAGLLGPWPDNDWPEAGESIWGTPEKSKTLSKALTFKYLEVLSEDGKPVLGLHLNLPSEVSLYWDRKWPLAKFSATKDPALVNKLNLKGAKFGENVLVYARAKSKRWGRAVMRSRWVKLTAPLPSAPKGAKKP